MGKSYAVRSSFFFSHHSGVEFEIRIRKRKMLKLTQVAQSHHNIHSLRVRTYQVPHAPLTGKISTKYLLHGLVQLCQLWLSFLPWYWWRANPTFGVDIHSSNLVLFVLQHLHPCLWCGEGLKVMAGKLLSPFLHPKCIRHRTNRVLV